jgi:4-aminobutyrate aminotransferase-like enzyme
MEFIAQKFMDDPDLKANISAIIQILKKYKTEIDSVRGPVTKLKGRMAKELKRLEKVRGRALYFPYIGSGLGNGALVELEDGSVKYDFISGIGVHYLGHSNEDLIRVSLEGALSDILMQGNLQLNLESLLFQEKILQAARAGGGNFHHCFLTTSGAMANENALKIILHKKSPRSRILAFEHCFLGRTLSLSQITDKPAYRKGLPMNLQVDYIPFFDPAQPGASLERACEVLRKTIARYPDQHALMSMELVLGEGGFYPGSKEFFQSLVRILKENRIAIMVDEIQTFGRTPELFAFHYYGLAENVDVLTIGKLTQVCATLYSKEFNPEAGIISQTFTGSTVGLKAGLAILEKLLSGNFFGSQGKIARLHNYFVQGLKKISRRHIGMIHGPFGVGAMIAFTLGDGSPEQSNQFLKKLFANGVIAFIAGSRPARVRFLLPMGAIEENDCALVLDIIEKTLQD